MLDSIGKGRGAFGDGLLPKSSRIMITLSGISKHYPTKTLFSDLSLRISLRERMALVGPNGAGKSTLMKILAGLSEPDEGSVGIPPGYRIGYLPQEVTIEGEMTSVGCVMSGDQELMMLEEEMRALEKKLEKGETGVLDRYGEVQTRFGSLGGFEQETTARKVLAGLGFDQTRMDAKISDLSGGWRMRVALARTLVTSPDLLLLDEPTNHLDIPSIEWLEAFLLDFPGAVILISHDRSFMNGVVGGVIELSGGKATVFVGNYDEYLTEKERRAQALDSAIARQEETIAKTQDFIDRFRSKASKAKQVQSRIKALDRIERLEKEDAQKTVRFTFPAPARSGEIVATFKGIEKSYDGRAIVHPFDWILRRGSKVALIGPNGAGKSTLLKIMAGAVKPDAGSYVTGTGVTTAYYSQHQLEVLDPSHTVLASMESVAPDSESQTRIRGLLGAFLFRQEEVFKKVQVLSGGEKSRLALARLLLAPANLLLLDEPTNHLDLPSREALVGALDAYRGTLVFITHDRYVIEKIATDIIEVLPGSIRLFMNHRFETYRAKRDGVFNAAASPSPESSVPPSRKGEFSPEVREETEMIEKRLSWVEKEVLELEEEVQRLSSLASGAGSDARRAASKLSVAEKKLTERTAEWERLGSMLEKSGQRSS
jgi:ATP-binding cassette subfamily F protein 3